MEAINLENIIEDLTPWEILDYYDGPKLYSCKDSVGTIYLIYWLDETEITSEWLYLRVSQLRYEALKNSQISIFLTLSKPEDGFVFNVVNSGKKFTVSPIPEIDIDPMLLPDAGDFLNLSGENFHLVSHTSMLPVKLNSALATAIATNRHVLDLALEKTSNQYEIGCGKLGRILDAVQNSIYALACGPNNNLKKVPEEIKYKSELLFTAAFQGSVGIRLQSRSSQLFFDSPAEKATEILAILLEATNTPDTIVETVKSYNVLARSRFKNLLNILVESETSVNSSWGSPIGKEINSIISISNLQQSLRYLDESNQVSSIITTYECRLVGVDVESDFFAIIDSEKRLIKGRLSKALETKHFTVPSQITAKIEEVCKIDPLTNKEKWTYTLIDV